MNHRSSTRRIEENVAALDVSWINSRDRNRVAVLNCRPHARTGRAEAHSVAMVQQILAQIEKYGSVSDDRCYAHVLNLYRYDEAGTFNDDAFASLAFFASFASFDREALLEQYPALFRSPDAAMGFIESTLAPAM
jgi:hypothetical protein